MDKRGWPWKKRSSDSSSGNQTEQEAIKYVQITQEQLTKFTEAEEQVKVLNEKVSILDEKVSALESELATKESLVKQHAKVAEEAISGWEKAEAEAAALKLQLETITLTKQASDERAAYLDSALKECMKQIRNVKEESEQKLHDVVLAKNKQLEKVMAEFEDKITGLEQELIRTAGENDALLRNLQERSNMIKKLGDDKAEAEAEIEVLKITIQSIEREANTMKYEVHVLSKELEIRNEEKNMIARSSDVANKQHQEDLKKISKLEAECQRLRGLVRKKLPGPAALAQMKLEVDSLGRENIDHRPRLSTGRNSHYHHPSPLVREYELESSRHLQSENEFLAARILTMEDETKMLKEALVRCNTELQASRNLCAKTAGKLRSMEVQLLAANQTKHASAADVEFDGATSQNGSNLSGLTLVSEQGANDEASYSESLANDKTSELVQSRKDKTGDQICSEENTNHLTLMDDFLEMERIASETEDSKLKAATQKDGPIICAISEKNEAEHQLSGGNDSPLLKLQSRISLLFDSHQQPEAVTKVLGKIRDLLNEVESEVPHHSFDSSSANCTGEIAHEEMGESAAIGISSKQNVVISSDHGSESQELRDSVLQIHNFVDSLRRGRPSDYESQSDKVLRFSQTFDQVMSKEKHLDDFVITLADVLSDASKKSSSVRTNMDESENSPIDFVDKVALMENKLGDDEQVIENPACSISHTPCSSTVPECEGLMSGGLQVNSAKQICSLEAYEQLVLEKKNTEMELIKCKELVESRELKLSEAEQTIERLKLELVDAEKSISLAETQLKCMAESYNTLEKRALQLEEEIGSLRQKIDALKTELEDERESHEADLAKYEGLCEQIERYRNDALSSDDAETKSRQEREIAAAAQKLAQCQETILVLGRQLQTLGGSSPKKGRMIDDESRRSVDSHSRKASSSSSHMDLLQALASEDASIGGEDCDYSPLIDHLEPTTNHPNNSNHPTQRSRSSSGPNPEKHSSGFSRFFAKPKYES